MKFSHGNTTKCAVGSRVSQTAMVFPNVLKLSVGTGLPWGGADHGSCHCALSDLMRYTSVQLVRGVWCGHKQRAVVPLGSGLHRFTIKLWRTCWRACASVHSGRVCKDLV